MAVHVFHWKVTDDIKKKLPWMAAVTHIVSEEHVCVSTLEQSAFEQVWHWSAPAAMGRKIVNEMITSQMSNQMYEVFRVTRFWWSIKVEHFYHYY